MRATFTARFSDKVRWLGTVMVISKPGVTLLPPADKKYVWEAINSSSTKNLSEVIVVPVPKGYGVNVGIASEASGGGLATSIAKITTLFLGIGPSFSSQSGTTMPTGSWSQQYIVLEKDPDGMLFSIDMVTPPKPAVAQPDLAAQRIDEARKTAALEAKAYASALTQIRQERDKLALTLTVPTDKVTKRPVKCKMETYKDKAGKDVTMCPGSTSGYYIATDVTHELVTGHSETVTPPEVKK